MGIAASILPSFFNRSATVNILSKADAAAVKGDTKSIERELKNVTNKMSDLKSKNKCTTASGQSNLSDLNIMKTKLKNLLEPRSLNRPTAPQAKVSALPTARTGEGAKKANQPANHEALKLAEATAKQTKINALNTALKPVAQSFEKQFGIKYNEEVSIAENLKATIKQLNGMSQYTLDHISDITSQLIEFEYSKEDLGLQSCLPELEENPTHASVLDLVTMALNIVHDDKEAMEQQAPSQPQQTPEIKALQDKIQKTEDAIHKNKDNLRDEQLKTKLAELNINLQFEQNKVAQAPVSIPSTPIKTDTLTAQIAALKADIEKTTERLSKPSVQKNFDAFYKLQDKLESQQVLLNNLLNQ